MLRLEFAGRKAYHGGNFSNILKFVFCGAVFYFAVGQLWHTNRLFRVLCARPALPPEILEGKNEKFLAHKSPKLEIVCHSSSNRRRKMKNFWHTNCPNRKSCATPPQTAEGKWKIFGTQIAQIRNRVPLLTNLRRKMSNRRNKRRRVVIYRASSEQDTFKKRLSQKQEKSLLPSKLPSPSRWKRQWNKLAGKAGAKAFARISWVKRMHTSFS